MAYEKKPLKGFLFANKERKTEKHPTSKGYLVLSKELCEKMIKADNYELGMAAWIDTEKGHNSIQVDTWKIDNASKSDSVSHTGVPAFEGDSIPI